MLTGVASLLLLTVQHAIDTTADGHGQEHGALLLPSLQSRGLYTHCKPLMQQAGQRETCGLRGVSVVVSFPEGNPELRGSDPRAVVRYMGV